MGRHDFTHKLFSQVQLWNRTWKNIILPNLDALRRFVLKPYFDEFSHFSHILSVISEPQWLKIHKVESVGSVVVCISGIYFFIQEEFQERLYIKKILNRFLEVLSK